MTNDSNAIKELLGEEIMQRAINELGLQGAPEDIKLKLIGNIGEVILRRVTLELLTALPPEERDTFETMVGGGDGVALRAFLEKHIPDLEQFIRLHAEREYEGTKTAIIMEKQGA